MLDADNGIFDELADKIENAGMHLGSGIAWAGFWMGIALAGGWRFF